MPDRLVTPRFLTMCGFSFIVFISLFQLLPAAPFHILNLGGSTTVAGLFLGALTFSSASSAPFTGMIADRIGHRQVLIVVSLLLAVMVSIYAVLPGYWLMLGLVVVHGVIWSGLLAASGAYMTSTIPASRRAEGLGYWGLASVSAIGIAPPFGFWMFQFGWPALCFEVAALNVVMAAIAWWLPEDAPVDRVKTAPWAIEWRVLILSMAIGLVAFGYGSLTSFSSLFAEALGVRPNSLFLSVMAVAILGGRLSVGRWLDRIGHRRVLLPCLVVPTVGLVILTLATGPLSFGLAAFTFGAGFGLMFPSHTAYVMAHVSNSRRGAAFGAMLAAFDIGIALGSSALGWVIDDFGFRAAFAVSAVLAGLAVPTFLLAERKLGFR